MNLIKLSLTVAFISAAIFSAEAQKGRKKNKTTQNGYTITGTIQNASGKIYLEEMVSGSKFARLDSAVFNPDGSFAMEGKIKEPGLYRLFFGGNLAMLLPVENTRIEVGGNTTDLTGTAWSKGTRESDILQEMRKIRSTAQAKIQQLNQRYAVNQTNQDTVMRLQQEAMESASLEANSLRALVRENPKSLVSVYTVMSVLDAESNFAFADSMALVFDKQIPDSDLVKMLKERNDKFRATSVGGMAPDIKLPGPDGTEIALSSLRGKYVLIDFWASWCGPCRRENPNVVRLYNQYKDRNFEIFGVSLDKDKDKWLQAIQADDLTWKHVSDLKFWQSEAAQIYNITSIPATILIDPKGKIVAKNLRGPALEEKVAQLVGK